jgi:hypothetical protein
MTLNLQAGWSREIAIAMVAIFVVAAFLVYRLGARRSRRRRIIAVELRLEAAWQNFKTTFGMGGSRKRVLPASPFTGGLQAGPQGRVLSIHPLAAPAVKEPEPQRVPLAGVATAGAEPSSAANIETVQQTQISCDI